MELKKLAVQELYVLTELFDYNNVEQMISECTHDIQNGIIDIFVCKRKIASTCSKSSDMR